MKYELHKRLYEKENADIENIGKYVKGKGERYVEAGKQIEALSKINNDEKGAIRGIEGIVAKYKPGERYTTEVYDLGEVASIALANKFNLDNLYSQVSDIFGGTPYKEVRRVYKKLMNKIKNLKKDTKYILKNAEQSKLFALYENAQKDKKNTEQSDAIMIAIKPYLKKKVF